MNNTKQLSLKTVTWPFFLRTEMDRLLFLSMGFSVLLVLLRIFHTGSLLFGFMIWNLFLAYIPYALTSWMSTRPQGISRRTFFIPLALVWLLFIPNSFYILTDLFHLPGQNDGGSVPAWYDLALILSFAWNGLLLGVLSVRQMEKFLLKGSSVREELLFLYPVMWLNALGVYIGRYLRYNSWDVIKNPFELLDDIARMIIHPLRNQPAWDMILCFSILMTLIYVMMKRISKAL